MTANGMVDLHTHTNHSDGLLPPEKLVQLAAEAGLRAIAITDHDEVGGLEVAVAAGQQHGVEVIAGVELSVTHRGYDIHILGYLIDFCQPDLLEFLNYFRAERLRRVQRILEKLEELGYPVPFDTVMRNAGAGSIGRPHIADAMVESGHVLSYQEAFNRFIADGKPAFVPKVRISAAQAIAIIHQANGLACLAHPGQNLTEEIVLEVIKAGVDAIEVVHPKHGYYQRELFRQYAKDFGLLETGGSDFHGGRKGEEKLGDYVIDYEKVERMKERHHLLSLAAPR
ncbi:MAG: PHP domain-containing protein [candidate division KSB1 bacterium]|nr:PHP domain-containing protein [candidate division KSB1 bacterium]MDZ7301334.1 PHP domain-containing protein [candidate division KSB1 bacterium]MDZ7310781.1 PHP domain-containing protein [candidate division KSB1 bacterium]